MELNDITIPTKTLNNRKATLFLGKECENINQSLYSSQLYGTFFGVDGVFTVEKLVKEKRKITSIKLNIINYKGTVNIGLVNAKWNDKKQWIDFRVRGMADPKKIIEVDLGSKELIFDDGDDLIFMRNLALLNVPGANGSSEMQKLNVFDSEFFDRDGEFRFPRIRYEELNPTEVKVNLEHEVNKEILERQGNNLPTEIPIDDDEKITILRPGNRCVPAILTIRF